MVISSTQHYFFISEWCMNDICTKVENSNQTLKLLIEVIQSTLEPVAAPSRVGFLALTGAALPANTADCNTHEPF